MVPFGKNAPMGAVRRSFLLSPQNLLTYCWLLLVSAGVYALTGGGSTPNYAWWAVLALSACGTFLLAMHTNEHQQAYKEGVEAEFFSNHTELTEKARHYLSEDAARIRIARQGRQRCLHSGYSWLEIMLRDWAKIKALA
jgi:hypothetical protein